MDKGKEKIQKILDLIPGKDCSGRGGCGKTTCLECAEEIVRSGNPGMCPACSQEQADRIAEIIGTESVKIEKKIAFIACGGSAAGKERFAGAGSCEAARDSGFRRGECKNGCLGLGSCIDFCDFGAMRLENGSVVIDREKCTGCMACANGDSCVQKLIHMVPADATNFIPCSSAEEDEETVRKICGYGCIACGECERVCPEGAVTILRGHAVIDYDKCVGCVACTVKCKKKIIVDTLHDLSEMKENVAFVRCSGGGKSGETFRGLGLTSCREAAKQDPKDYGLCTTGCTGLGDCTKVCRYDAIHIVDGTAFVDVEKCVGCRDCTDACPKQLIVMVPYKGSKMIPCASEADYEDKTEICGTACIGCGDCQVNCPNGAIYMEEAHAVVDPTLCENCNACQYVCPRNIIRERKVPEYNYLQREALEFGKERE